MYLYLQQYPSDTKGNAQFICEGLDLVLAGRLIPFEARLQSPEIKFTKPTSVSGHGTLTYKFLLKTDGVHCILY